jgi:Lrp/AsnC family transcriptional regulator, regulator for asnA, asnC and gidA
MSDIDEIDAQIVNLLIDDGRLSCAEIARKIGNVSERSVRYRLERMIAGGAVKVGAIPNPKALGYSIVADVWLKVESDAILEVAHKLAGYEWISYVACAIGENDLSIQIIAHDTDEVYKFVTETIGKTPGVRKTTTAIVPLVIKDVYQWKIPGSSQGES